MKVKGAPGSFDSGIFGSQRNTSGGEAFFTKQVGLLRQS